MAGPAPEPPHTTDAVLAPTPAPAGWAGEAERAALVAALFRPLARHTGVALAVSGGADSVALMHLAADWRAAELAAGRTAPHLVAMTVDHGLRPGSAAEAREVARMAAALGLPHEVLTWHGDKPARGVQSTARTARYGLLEAAMATAGVGALATAHTADDQAETLVMRLARASGPDGLAAMRDVRELPGGALHYRPLLAVTKAELVAELRRRGAPWIEDPSNENTAFERVRIRRAAAELSALGLTSRALATSAARTGRLVALADRLIDDRIRSEPAAVALSVMGYVEIRRAWLETLPGEARLRLLAHLVHVLGGGEGPPPLAPLEAKAEVLGGLGAACGALRGGGFTLAGAVVEIADDAVLVTREPLDARRPRDELPSEIAALPLPPGARTVWDRRFAIALAQDAPAGLVCGPLGADGVQHLGAAGVRRPERVPARALWALPAIYAGDRLAGVPHLGVWLHPDRAPGVAVRLARRLPYGSIAERREISLPHRS